MSARSARTAAWLMAEAREYGLHLQVITRPDHMTRCTLWDSGTHSQWVVSSGWGVSTIRVRRQEHWYDARGSLHNGWNQLGYVELDTNSYMDVHLHSVWDVRSVCLAYCLLSLYSDPLV